MMPNPHNAFVPRRRYEIVSYQWQYKFGCHRQNGRFEGRGAGQVVRVLTFYSVDPSSYSPEDKKVSVKLVF